MRDHRYSASIAAGTAVLIILVLAAFALRDIRGMLRDQEWVAHTNLVIETLNRIQLQVDDAETAQRGYIITGRDEFLEPYRGVDGAAETTLTRLERLVADNRPQELAADSLRRFVASKLAFVREAIQTRRAYGFQAAADLVGTGQGRTAMESVRAVIERMKKRETNLLLSRSDRQRRRLSRAELVGTAGIFFAAFLAFISGMLVVRTVAILSRGRDTAAYLRTLMNGTSDGIYGLDKEGRITFVNRGGAEMLGYAREELIGQIAHPLVHHTRPDGTPYPASECPMYRAAMEGISGPVDNEIIWRKDGSSFPVEYSLNSITDRQGHAGAVVSFRDITERQISEKALREAKEGAERANFAKSEFLARMSHELRTPLNSVIGFANVLLRNKSGSLRQEDVNYVDRIQKNGVRLLDLINDILDLSKIEAGRVDLEVAPVDVAELMREVAAEFEMQMSARGLTLDIDVPPILSPLTTDRQKLLQVMLNLVGNAIKFTEKGGVKINVGANARGMPWSIEVSDTGIGIPGDRMGAIFEPFEQAESSTTRRFGGTGLGLPISRSLCQLLGFALTVRSQPGKGSTFLIDLAPERIQPAAQSPADRVAGNDTALRGKTVLIIDDDPDARELVKMQVADLGARSIEAGSGEEGLKIAREMSPDIIVLDLAMPVKNGWEVMKELAADPALKTIPVVIVSGNVPGGKAALLGAVKMLPKPLDANTFAVALLGQVGKGKVLIVDDDPDTRELLVEYAYEEGAAEVRVASGGAEAIQAMDEFTPDLILLDILMPGVDGFAVLSALDAHPQRDKTSVIIISSTELSTKATAEMRVSVVGILRKGGNLEAELRTLLRSHLSGADTKAARDLE